MFNKKIAAVFLSISLIFALGISTAISFAEECEVFPDAAIESIEENESSAAETDEIFIDMTIPEDDGIIDLSEPAPADPAVDI